MVDYQALFPPVLRGGAGVSTWWRWRGRDVHVARLRDPSAPVVCVLLHGAGAHSALLLPYGRLLHADVVAPDLPGYGRSSGPFDYTSGWTA